MINWQRPWRAFRSQEDKESYFLGEMRWELESHPDHCLTKVTVKIVGWIPGYDHFVVLMPEEHQHAYVGLNWNKEGKRLPPTMEHLGTEQEVEGFIQNWNG